MSVESMGVVLRHSRAGGTDKLVLLGIANHAGDGGSWPSVETLADYANVQPRAVRKSLARLVECPDTCEHRRRPSCPNHLREIRRYVQQGGLAGWDDYTRPNRYDVLVECPEGCAGGQQHKARKGWLYDRELREYVRLVEISTGDTPETHDPSDTPQTPPVQMDTPCPDGQAPPVRADRQTVPITDPSCGPVSAQRHHRGRREMAELRELSTATSEYRQARAAARRRTGAAVDGGELAAGAP